MTMALAEVRGSLPSTVRATEAPGVVEVTAMGMLYGKLTLAEEGVSCGSPVTPRQASPTRSGAPAGTHAPPAAATSASALKLELEGAARAARPGVPARLSFAAAKSW
jgi:hypothetical protein